MQARRRASRWVGGGFTLVELVVAISTGSVISLMAGTLLLEGGQVVARATQRAALAQSGGRMIEQMLRHVREIEQDAGYAGLAQISSATATEIVFGTRGFRQNGSVIEMSADGATTWRRACASVASLALRYYDRNGSELTAVPLSAGDRAAVRQVSIELRLSANGETIKLRSRVYLRRFMNEAAT